MVFAKNWTVDGTIGLTTVNTWSWTLMFRETNKMQPIRDGKGRTIRKGEGVGGWGVGGG